MKDAKILSGKKNLSNVISDIIVMEAHDVEKWLKPGQLVLTSLFSLQNSNEEECSLFIRRVVSLGASGLIIKLGRFVDVLPEGIVSEGILHDFPIIVIDSYIEYRDIILEVMHNILNKKADMLKIFQNVHHEFKGLSTKAAPIKEVILALKRLIDADISLEDKDGNIIESTWKKTNVEIIDSRELYHESYMTYSYTRQLVKVDGRLASQLVVRINLDNQPEKYLVIAETERFVLMRDYMAIENACSSVEFEYAKKLALSKVKQSHVNDLVDQVLNGKYQTNEDLMELVHVLHLSSNKQYRVITWLHRPDLNGKRTSFEDREALLQDHYSLVKRLKEIWPRFAYRVFANRITFIMEDNFETDGEFKRFLVETIDTHRKTLLKGLAIMVGISDKVEISQIHEISIQPLKIIQVGQLQHKKDFIMDYAELGMYRLFFDLKNSLNLMDYVSDTILNMEESNRETLRVFLENNQNYKDTSEILYVHPKTVKYRIDRMKEVNKIDFSDPEVVLQLILELRFIALSKI